MKLTKQGVRDLGGVVPVVRHVAVVPVVISDGRPRVAVDVAVSERDIFALDRAGFYVAVCAEHGEPDASWLLRAERALVDIVVSPDKEVAVWAYEHDAIFVRLSGSRRNNVVSRVRQEWRKWQAWGNAKP